MTPVTKCLECGTDIPSEAKGLCPKCLLKLGLASQLAPGFIETGVQPAPFLGFDPAHPGKRAEFEAFEFGGYLIQRLLGRGGMGAVYEAEEKASGRRVALKVLGHSLESADLRKRFIREGRLAASINHPNSVYVYGTEEIQGTPVITMELVPGGTLHERIKKNGPMGVDEAVSAILQVIAGLEAAHKVGILHRDIKPSNCFIEPSGAVKIGDFGLSISTLSRGDSAVTLVGSVLGTPAFSSPEQLRGEELNVRSDIYSVGMTLYYLLTGRAAFDAENMVQLLATVLDKAPPSPRALRPEIPPNLAQIILRCLAKPAGERFGSYDELRQALLPFHTLPQPAPLRMRITAMAIDFGILFLATSLLEVLFKTESGLVWYSVLGLLSVVYFTISEGIWGRSRGKAAVGLVVIDPDRGVPGLSKAFLRAILHLPILNAWIVLPSFFIFLLFCGLLPVMNAKILDADGQELLMELGFYLAVLSLFVACICTMRRRNGFATIHDLWTKTRVVQEISSLPRLAINPPDEAAVSAETKPQLGPYHVVARVDGETEGSELLLGYDTKLLRRVWIRKVHENTEPVSIERRNVARAGRLRWLQGQRTETGGWDAYEFVHGTPLLEVIEKRQPWEIVRHWLRDLCEELVAGGNAIGSTLNLEHVWITAEGRAKLLDFPAPQRGRKTTTPDAVPPLPQIFLKRFAISALEGREVAAEEVENGSVAVPLPIAARRLINGISARTTLPAISADLESLMAQPPCLTRGKRLGLALGSLAPSFLMVICLLMALIQITETNLAEEQLDMECLTEWISDYEATPTRPLVNHSELPDSVLKKNASHAYEAAIAVHFGDFVRNPATWNSKEAMELSRAHRLIAEKIVRENPKPTAKQMAEAELIKKTQFSTPEVFLKSSTYFITIAGFNFLVFGLSLFTAIAFRRGVMLRLLGLEVVYANGMMASRTRITSRNLIAWVPMLAVLSLAALSVRNGSWFLATMIGLIGVALLVWSTLRPERSLQDWMAGTWLVPADQEGPKEDSDKHEKR